MERSIDATGSIEETKPSQDIEGELLEDVVMLSISEEMTELEEMIKLQQRKLDILGEVRKKLLLAEKTGIQPQMSADMFKEVLAASYTDVQVKSAASLVTATPSQARAPSSTEVASPPEHQYIAPQTFVPPVQARGPVRFETYMVDRATIATSTPIDHVMVLPIRTRLPQPGAKKTTGSTGKTQLNFAAVIDTNSTLHIYNTQGEIMISYHTGHTDGVVAWGFDATDHDPMIATAGKDGLINLHIITLWRHDRVIAGPRAPPKRSDSQENGGIQKVKAEPPVEPSPLTNHTSKVPTVFTSDRYGVTISLRCSATPHMFENSSENATVTAMFLAQSRSEKVLFVVGSEGTLVQYHKNGTLANKMSAGAPINAIARAGQYAVYSTGPDLNFLGMARFKLSDTINCKGTMSNVFSLASDVLSSGVVYAGLESGDVLVFSTRRQDETSCKLIQKLPAKVGGSPVQVSSIRGYLIATAGSMVSVYNTSSIADAGAHWLFDHVIEECEGAAQLNVAIPNPMVNRLAEVLFISNSRCQPNQLNIYECLLPYYHHEVDIRWLRFPLLLVGLVGVFGYQWWKRRPGASSGPDMSSFSGRGGRDRTIGGRAGKSVGFDLDDESDFRKKNRY